MSLPYSTSANLPYGSRVLTINSLGFIANNMSWDEPASLLERQNELGAPNGAVLIEQARTGSAQLQLATSAITPPARGDTFATTVRGATVTCFLTSVGLPEDQGQFKSVSVNFREAI